MNRNRIRVTGEVVELDRDEAGRRRVLGLEVDDRTYLIKPSRLAKELESVTSLPVRIDGWVVAGRRRGLPVLEVIDYDVVIGNEVGAVEPDL
jgi:hypothetical protein